MKLHLLWLCVFLLAACTNYEAADVPSRMVELNVPVGGYVYATMWLPDGRAAGLIEVEDVFQLYLDILPEGSDETLPLELEPDPVCSYRTHYYIVGWLPDGRLGMNKTCYGEFKGTFRPDTSYVMAYDWDLGELQQLVAGKNPSHTIGYFVWNPEMTRGIQAIGGLNSILTWLTPEGPEPMGVVVRDGRRSFSLAANYERLISGFDILSTGVARLPAWSPDGKTIAFLANLEAIGRKGMYRTSGKWGLYLMEPSELTPRKVLGGLYNPGTITWSPDSAWLAMKVEIASKEGLWLFHPASRKLVLIAAGNMQGANWSRDGTKILSLKCSEAGCFKDETARVWEYDVHSIVNATP